jgi:hypothetical protein
LIALALAEDAAWSGAPPVSEEEAGEFVDFGGPRVIFERGGGCGYAVAREGGGTLLILDPADDPGEALEALVPWLAEHGRHEVDSYAGDVRRIAWLEANGFTYERSGFDLHRGIEPPPASPIWPDGVAVARYRRGEDDEAVPRAGLVDAAWGEVPGHHERRWSRGGRRSSPSRAAGSRAATSAPSAGSSAACSATGADGSTRSPSPSRARRVASAARSCCTRWPTFAQPAPPRWPLRAGPQRERDPAVPRRRLPRSSANGAATPRPQLGGRVGP